MTASALGKPDARGLLEESLVLSRRVGSLRGEGETIGSLGGLAEREGDLEQAIELYEQSAAIVAPLGFTWWQLNMLGAIAECALELGRIDETSARALEALALGREISDRQNIVYALACLARVAAERGEAARADRLWGALEAEEERGPVGQWKTEREAFAARVLTHGGPELKRGRGEGRRLSLEAAIDEALESP